MRLWHFGALTFAISALTVHAAILFNLPSSIMTKARGLLEARGLILHEWSASPRMTPETQTFVRPSPDLAYAVCLFDVTGGPIEISAPAWDGYASLSVFDRNTNAVFVTSLDAEIDEPRGVILASREAVFASDGDLPIVRLKEQGIAIIRRLAPSDERHAAAQALVESAICRPMPE